MGGTAPDSMPRFMGKVLRRAGDGGSDKCPISAQHWLTRRYMSHFQASRHADRTSSRTKAETRETTSAEVREEIEEERRAVEERTERLRAIRLAHENKAS